MNYNKKCGDILRIHRFCGNKVHDTNMTPVDTTSCVILEKPKVMEILKEVTASRWSI